MHLPLPLAVTAAALLLGSAVTSQGRHVFVLNTNQSALQFSGTATIQGLTANLVGQPATFNVSGALSADLTVNGGAVTDGRMLQGNNTTIVVPTLNAIIPNPLPFLPPLARVAISGGEMVLSSPTFSIAANGSFSTMMTGTMVAGSATVSGLINQTIDLAGQSGPPQPFNGNIKIGANSAVFDSPIQTTFPFSDPTSGVTASLTLTGRLAGRGMAVATDTDTVSIVNGGQQSMTLSAGSSKAGKVYLMLGSSLGTQPGFTLTGVQVPLNPDSYFFALASAPNNIPVLSSLGVLDSAGTGTSTFFLPALGPGLAVLAGLKLDHAYILIDGTTVVMASNAVPVTLTK